MSTKKHSSKSPAWAVSHEPIGGNGAPGDIRPGANPAGLPTDAPQDQRHTSAESSDPFAHWRSAPLAELVSHLASEHTRWTRGDLPRMEEFIRQASSQRLPTNSALGQIAAGLARLRNILTRHFLGEEQVLFPTAVALERAVETQSPIGRPSFGSVRNPVSMLQRDHDEEVHLMKDLRGICEEHNFSAAASEELRRLGEGMRDLHDTLAHHRQVENEVLFPRMIELERTALEFES